MASARSYKQKRAGTPTIAVDVKTGTEAAYSLAGRCGPSPTYKTGKITRRHGEYASSERDSQGKDAGGD
jgi:hypothetical protein